MDFPRTGFKNIEMWKALISSEPTTIKDGHWSFSFKHAMPTIVTTNNKDMFDHLLKSGYYNNDCIFFWVKQYLGPPGTNPRGDVKKRINFSIDDWDTHLKKKIHLEEREEELK